MSFAYLPLFTGDYLRDTRHLSPLKHGIYLLALMHCWDQKGPLPLDEQECAGICNCRSSDEIDALRYVLERYFLRLDDGLYNKRMAEEVARTERLSKAFHEAGLKSAEARRTKAREGALAKAEGRLKVGSANPQPRLVSPSPSPSSEKTKEKDKDGASADADADVWTFGIDLLTREGGLGKGTARSYLGALLKSWSEATVLDALMASAGKADPKAYARKWLDDKPRKGQMKRSATDEALAMLEARGK